jgi:predicted lipoprotein
MVGDWTGAEGWRKRMLEPGPQNASYKTPAEPPAEFARALITGLQMLQDRQVAPLIAANTASGKPARLAFAGSDLSARYVAAGVKSLNDLYEAMGLGRDVPKDKAWMPKWIAMAFKRLARDAPAAVKRNGPTAQGEERTRELRMLRFHVEGIRKLVGRELAPNAGLMIGFNELDGD